MFDNLLNRYKYKYDFMTGLIAFIKQLVAIIKSLAESMGVELPTLKIGQ